MEEQPPQQPPRPEPQPWGGQPWRRAQQPPQPPPPPRQWGEPPAPARPWGYQPPPAKPPRPPGAPPPWYRQPVGILLIGAAVVILLALIVPAFTGGGDPVPTVTTGAFGAPGPTTAPAAPTTVTGQPPSPADQLAQAIQAELGSAGEVVSVTAPPNGPVTVTWEIKRAGSRGLTENNARFGVMRIMRAVQQSQLTAGGRAPAVRLLGRYQLAGAAAPVIVLRLRFAPATVERTDFDDRRYLEAFELADTAAIHPAFRG